MTNKTYQFQDITSELLKSLTFKRKHYVLYKDGTTDFLWRNEIANSFEYIVGILLPVEEKQLTQELFDKMLGWVDDDFVKGLFIEQFNNLRGKEKQVSKEEIEKIAQWVIDNRYAKSEKEKLSDWEMYDTLIYKFSQLIGGGREEKQYQMIEGFYIEDEWRQYPDFPEPPDERELPTTESENQYDKYRKALKEFSLKYK